MEHETIDKRVKSVQIERKQTGRGEERAGAIQIPVCSRTDERGHAGKRLKDYACSVSRDWSDGI